MKKKKKKIDPAPETPVPAQEPERAEMLNQNLEKRELMELHQKLLDLGINRRSQLEVMISRL